MSREYIDSCKKILLDKIEYDTAQIELAKKYGNNAYEHENDLARDRVNLAGVNYWATVCDDNGSISISKYFEIRFLNCNGVQFAFKDEIENDVYKYAYDSYSELYRIVNERLVPFLSPVVDEYYAWGQGESYHLDYATEYLDLLKKRNKYDIKERKYEEDIVNTLRATVKRLTSDEVKPYLELAEKYVDMLIEKGKADE